jgi:hypothetical protein
VLAVNPGHHSRNLIGLLFAVLGVLALADSAAASGCHVPDRPVFGMTVGQVVDGPLASDPDPGLLVPHTSQYRHAPCPGESAGFPTKFQFSQAADSTSILHRPVTYVDGRWVESPDLGHPLAHRNPLERPPRFPSPLAAN